LQSAGQRIGDIGRHRSVTVIIHSQTLPFQINDALDVVIDGLRTQGAICLGVPANRRMPMSGQDR
jgi:hypothetical protein